MGLKRWAKEAVNGALQRRGSQIVRTETLYDWQLSGAPPRRSGSPLPADAASYLRPDNPKLLDLTVRYSKFDPAVTPPLIWTEGHLHPEDIAYFRGDNAWVWQVRGRHANALGYALTFYYLKTIDRLSLLDNLSEDGGFGAFTFQIGGRSVSRDVLDSVSEIYFLDRHLGIVSKSSYRVLDIGAGYGRLAHRMTSALPGIEKYLCTDAVPSSTFVSEYYLRFRGANRATVVPLDQIDERLRDSSIDLTVNVHSFSECRISAIEWWAKLLSKHGIKRLMIVPNGCGTKGERLFTNDGQDFLPILERNGYRTILKEPKFLDPVVQEYGLDQTWYHLLELQS